MMLVLLWYPDSSWAQLSPRGTQRRIIGSFHQRRDCLGIISLRIVTCCASLASARFCRVLTYPNIVASPTDHIQEKWQGSSESLPVILRSLRSTQHKVRRYSLHQLNVVVAFGSRVSAVVVWQLHMTFSPVSLSAWGVALCSRYSLTIANPSLRKA